MTDVLLLASPHVCTFVYPQWRTVETRFSDGSVLIAAPMDTDSYRETAERYGYGADLWSLCRDHELTHTILALSRGLQWCPVLHDAAHPDRPRLTPDEESWRIEDQVLNHQLRWWDL